MGRVVFCNDFSGRTLANVLNVGDGNGRVSLFFVGPRCRERKLKGGLFRCTSALRPSVRAAIGSSACTVPFCRDLKFTIMKRGRGCRKLYDAPVEHCRTMFMRGGGCALHA